MNSEQGRELKASELKVRTVVLVKPPEKAVMITLWVVAVTEKLVEFRAGEINWHILNFVALDGTIVDDCGRQVHVFEYLGAV